MRAPSDPVMLDRPRGTLCVRISATFLARARGLLCTASLQPDHGLLILPCRSIHTMGMRYPIDALFLDDGARIVDMRTDLAPWRGAFSRSAVAVLELACGAAAAFDFRHGEHLAEFGPLLSRP